MASPPPRRLSAAAVDNQRAGYQHSPRGNGVDGAFQAEHLEMHSVALHQLPLQGGLVFPPVAENLLPAGADDNDILGHHVHHLAGALGIVPQVGANQLLGQCCEIHGRFPPAACATSVI